jgi:Rap1a immunity proteins
MRFVFLAVAFMLADAAQSRADEFDIRSGEQLLNSCQSGKPQETSSCRNYVTGTVETILLIRAQTFVCYFLPPDGFAEEQAIGVVVEHLKAHPDERSMSGAKAVMDALGSKYPCPQ